MFFSSSIGNSKEWRWFIQPWVHKLYALPARVFRFRSEFQCAFELRLTNFISFPLRQSLKEHIMQVHQPKQSDSPSVTSLAQHFSPPPTLLSPGNFPYGFNTGGSEGGRTSEQNSPNHSNTHACSYNQCSASFPTLELLEKHEMIQHSSGATNVVS